MSYSVDIYSANRRVNLQKVHHAGKVFAIVEEEDLGGSFEIVLNNNNYANTLAVCVVDGKNVASGEDGSKNGSGYVLSQNKLYAVKGWRSSNDEVQQFYFANKGDSYSDLMGENNNGVVGVAFWREKRPEVYNRALSSSYRLERKSSGLEACCSLDDVGAGYGNTIQDKVSTTTFDKVGTPTVFEIHYKTRRDLEALGVKLPIKMLNLPSAFPADNSFVPAPPR